MREVEKNERVRVDVRVKHFITKKFLCAKKVENQVIKEIVLVPKK